MLVASTVQTMSPMTTDYIACIEMPNGSGTINVRSYTLPEIGHLFGPSKLLHTWLFCMLVEATLTRVNCDQSSWDCNSV